jgi:hypothetical protein
MLGRKAIDYDKRDGYFVLTGEHLYSDSLLVFDFSDKLERLVFSADNMALAAINKFDKDNHYHYSLLVKNAYLNHVYASHLEGAVYVYGSAVTGETFLLNDKNHPSAIVQGYFIAKYRETYRVSVDNDIKGGTLIVPDTLVWHGKDVKIGVNSDEGMCLKSLYANGQLLSVNEEGKYFLRNLSEPVVLSAEFVEASSIFEMESDKELKISPNPVGEYLNIENGSSFAEIEIVSAEGKVLRCEKGSNKLSLSDLASGLYTLKAKTGDQVIVKKFIKR